MANRYEEAFSGLLDLVRGGKEFHEKYHKNICESIGAIINLGLAVMLSILQWLKQMNCEWHQQSRILQ